MSRPGISAARLARIERTLERIGLLFEHDRVHPSFTGLAAGEPIAGSWWSHALAHPIYEAIQVFCERRDVLWAKLVNRKVTYVHPRLWPAFFAVARERGAERTARLSEPARALFALVEQRGSLRMDELAASGFASARELSAAMAQLEARLLVRADSVHTASGAHAKVAQSWSFVCAERGYPEAALPLPQARAELTQAARELTRAGPRPAKLGFE